MPRDKDNEDKQDAQRDELRLSVSKGDNPEPDPEPEQSPQAAVQEDPGLSPSSPSLDRQSFIFTLPSTEDNPEPEQSPQAAVQEDPEPDPEPEQSPQEAVQEDPGLSPSWRSLDRQSFISTLPSTADNPEPEQSPQEAVQEDPGLSPSSPSSLARVFECIYESSLVKSVVQSPTGTLIIKLFLSCLALLPTIDICTDVAVLGQWFFAGRYTFFAVGFALLVLSWRFTTLYAAINARPTHRNIARLYFPMLLTPSNFKALLSARTNMEPDEEDPRPRAHTTWAYCKALEVSHASSSEPASSPPGSLLATSDSDIGLPAQKAAPEYIFSEILFLAANVRHWQGKIRTLLSKWMGTLELRNALLSYLFLFGRSVIFECWLMSLSLVAGPYFTAQASFRLANATISSAPSVPEVRQDKRERMILLSKVVTFVESVFESVPQLVLQVLTSIFILDEFRWYHAISLSTQGMSILYAVFCFQWDFQNIKDVLIPSRVIDVAVRHGYFIDAVIFKFDDGTERSYGGSGGGYTHGISLVDGEVIVKVEGLVNRTNPSYLGRCWKFTTSRGREETFMHPIFVPSDASRYEKFKFENKLGITGLRLEGDYKSAGANGEQTQFDGYVVGIL